MFFFYFTLQTRLVSQASFRSIRKRQFEFLVNLFDSPIGHERVTSDKRLRAIFDLVVCMQELDMFLDDRVRVFVSELKTKRLSLCA